MQELDYIVKFRWGEDVGERRHHLPSTEDLMLNGTLLESPANPIEGRTLVAAGTSDGMAMGAAFLIEDCPLRILR